MNDFIFGIHAIQEAFNNKANINKILIQKDIQNKGIKNLIREANQLGIKVQYVPLVKLNQVCKGNHQGAIAYMDSVAFAPFDKIFSEVYNQHQENTKILMLDRITDVRNFGAIARTAECMGVQLIVVAQSASAPINAFAIKTSGGALHKLPVSKVSKLSVAVTKMQRKGINVVSCTEKADTEANEVDFSTPWCIIMGSEENGISDDLISLSDQWAKIPMSGSIESLNVGVATGIILYEALRQENN